MSTKEEPSTYFFDNKDAKYYRNRSLNNCKSRTRYINKIYNSLISCKNTLDEIIKLEEQKDVYIEKDSNLTDALNSLEECIKYIQQYSNNSQNEIQELMSRNFDDIIKNNVNDIKRMENEKGCEEI